MSGLPHDDDRFVMMCVTFSESELAMIDELVDELRAP